jgi:hypothetical protein
MSVGFKLLRSPMTFSPKTHSTTTLSRIILERMTDCHQNDTLYRTILSNMIIRCMTLS